MNITLHLPTAAITIAIGSLALFGMSASAPQSPPPDRDVQAVEDIGRPKPRDLVWMYATGGPPVSYTVPVGKTLVITGVNFGGYSGRIRIDGGPDQFIYTGNLNGGCASLSGGISLAEGQTIETESTGWIFGHLVDA